MEYVSNIGMDLLVSVCVSLCVWLCAGHIMVISVENELSIMSSISV